jgi:PAS domain S-box-containing protein
MKSELKDLALRLQAIIDTAIDGIITIDSWGNMEMVNNAAASYFGYSQDELVGHNVKVLMPEPDKSKHDGYIKNYRDTKNPRIIGIGREVTGKRKDGSTFPFRLAVSEVILNDRVIFTGIVHDLSDVKRAQIELKSLNEGLENLVEKRTTELESVVNKLLQTNRLLEEKEHSLHVALSKERELSQLKSRFVSMASHEFRTPLATIMSSASLISKYTESDQNDKREKHIERIKASVANLTGILNDFLSLSKIEEGKVQVNLEDINVFELCSEIEAALKGLLKTGQTIIHNSEPGISIYTDARILKNIIFNLVSNAIKYSPENTVIKCNIVIQEQICMIEIIDQGIGIPETEQKFLFERFFRASNVENIQGTGLGLNIVKRYVRLLNGSIDFKSVEGEGTSFIVYLPEV